MVALREIAAGSVAKAESSETEALPEARPDTLAEDLLAEGIAEAEQVRADASEEPPAKDEG